MRRYLAAKLCGCVLWALGQRRTRLVMAAWDDVGVLWGIHAPVWEPDPLPVARRIRERLSSGVFVLVPAGWCLIRVDQSREHS